MLSALPTITDAASRLRGSPPARRLVCPASAALSLGGRLASTGADLPCCPPRPLLLARPQVVYGSVALTAGFLYTLSFLAVAPTFYR